MPRRRRLRKVVAPPDFKGFRPYGSPHSEFGHVDLLYEEYEAIKLADYDLMNHHEACKVMGVSRPTFARIYESARRKIASALVNTREIRAVYGNAFFDKNWLVCHQCHARFTMPSNMNDNNCPVCRSTDIEPIQNQK
jgi:predicted DNA-binding protein (UPF0251 family)